MWQCPNCGERIDDVFDACWKCSADRHGADAAQAEAGPGDSDTLDANTGRETTNAIADDSAGTSGHAEDRRIVELCSAANPAEAYFFLALLEESGIRARIVGEALGSAAGSLPLGETVTPRIWVREEDAARAQTILADSMSDREQAAADGNDELADAEEEPEEDDLTPASAAPFRCPTFVVAGVACIVFGAVWAGLNWLSIHECSETTDGVFLFEHFAPDFSHHPRPQPEIPVPAEPSHTPFCYEVQYGYVVKGKTYFATDRDAQRAVRRVTIHYDPRHPETHFIGSVTPPWLILLSALGLGTFLAFIGCLPGWNTPSQQVGQHEPNRS